MCSIELEVEALYLGEFGGTKDRRGTLLPLSTACGQIRRSLVKVGVKLNQTGPGGERVPTLGPPFPTNFIYFPYFSLLPW